jgi:hypothetical protein
MFESVVQLQHPGRAADELGLGTWCAIGLQVCCARCQGAGVVVLAW